MKRTFALISLFALFGLSGCLPGEQDVSEKYNAINQRTQIENTGISLMQAANAMTAHLVAASMRLKAPLDDIGVTTLPSISDNPEPVPPPGVRAVPCGNDNLGSMSYFIAQPKGVPDLKSSGTIMAKALAQRYGAHVVGYKNADGSLQLPEIAQDIGCTVGGDIVANSPIFVSGFEYEGYEGTLGKVMADSRMSTQPTITRDVTIPCPSGMQGVIKREQKCKLISSNDPNKKEKTTVLLGGKKTKNQANRLDKEWRCTPDLSTPLQPTADEVTDYCIDPNAGLVKQPDNTIQMNVANVKQILETGAGLYDFKCRQNADGSNSCDAKPYDPSQKPMPRNVVMRCDPQPVPEQYVINPILPIQVDANGKVLSETPTAAKTGPIVGNRSCGQGWMGDLIAGYQVRACRLVRVENGVTTPIKLAQTIYKIGYVGARCTQPPKEATYYCPRPYDGQLLLRESNYMLKPLALQLGNAPAGEWSPSTIPFRLFGNFGNANAETIARAAQEGYKIARWPLQGVSNPRFSSLLEATMQPDIMKEITGCKLAGQNCEAPPDPIKLGIVFDRSGSMTNDDPPSIASSSNRMSCQAELSSIFTDQAAACEILSNNNRDVAQSYERPIESILGQYLIEPSNPVYNRIMIDAIQNNKQCGEVSVDVVGYCVPGKGTRQSSCIPGNCVGVGGVTGKKLAVAQDQLRTAIGYIPPGSEFWFTEYVNTGRVEPEKVVNLCNTVTDDNCDYAAALEQARNTALSNSNLPNMADTPLMEATTQALKQFGEPGPNSSAGILLYFTDGEETDGPDRGPVGSYRNDYPYKFGSLCQNKFPPSDITSDVNGNFCRGIGFTENSSMEEIDVKDLFESLYEGYNCESPSSNTSIQICGKIAGFYNGNQDKLVGTAWRDCLRHGTSFRPSVVDYIKENYPNLKVFILNLGSRELAPCENVQNQNIRMINVADADGFKSAFTQAFGDLSTKGASAEDVCRRIRANSYPNAVSY